MVVPRQDLSPDEVERAARVRDLVLGEVGKAVIGMDEVVGRLLVTLLSGGHALLEGVPGVAKTTVARSFAGASRLGLRRIQFTPDLLPGDITGTHIFNAKTSEFELRRGPVFTNIVLADEINRAPAKTQAALLECMQERQVTIEGQTLTLDQPFIVLATQNPIEQEGVYPLPEAQVDRFLMKLAVGYPSADAERHMMLHQQSKPAEIVPVVDAGELLALQESVSRVHMDEALIDYVLGIAWGTRQHPSAALGVSPRGCLAIQQASRTWAMLSGRDYVVPDDVRELAGDVLHHRVILTPEAELDGETSLSVLEDVLESVPVPGIER